MLSRHPSLRDVVVAVRNLRSEYNVAPSKELDVTVQLRSAESKGTLEQHGGLVRTLARVGKLTLATAGEPPPGTVVSVVGDAQVCVHLLGTVDFEAEMARIDKDLAKTEKERAGVSGRLGNPSFVERAPEDIVAKERARLAELEDKIGKLKDSLDRLAKMKK